MTKIVMLVLSSWLLWSTSLCAEPLEATLFWVNKVPLSTPLSGVVQNVNASAGDFVQKNTLLMRLEGRAFQANAQARQAELLRATNDSKEAQKELQRTQELYDRTLISDHDLELAVIQRDAALANAQRAQADWVEADMDVIYAQLRAPFDGWVLTRNVAEGETIISRLQATPLFVLVEAGLMGARAYVSAQQWLSLERGAKARVRVNGVYYSASLQQLGLEPQADDANAYAVEVVFNTGSVQLPAGLAASVEFQ
jgi:RND family efflux transporter MFP subunit